MPQACGPVYGIKGVLLLYSFVVVVGPLVLFAVIRGWHLSDNAAMLYGSQALFFLAVCFVWFDRPRLLTLSRWRPRWSDLAVGISGGLLVKSLVMLCVSDPVKFLTPPYLPAHSFLPIAVAGSTLEEIVFRGVLLKSLRARLPGAVAVLIVVFLAAIGHNLFWFAVPMQLTFSIIYMAMGDSLAASISAHIVSNALLYLPVAHFFEKWHIFTLWRI